MRLVTTMRCLFSDGMRCTLKHNLCLNSRCQDLLPGYGLMVTGEELGRIMAADPKLCPSEPLSGAPASILTAKGDVLNVTRAPKSQHGQ